MYRRFATAFVVIGLALVVTPVHAHFPWLVVNADGRVLYFFGENIAERTYKLPPTVAKAKVLSVREDGEVKKIELKETKTEDCKDRQAW